MKTYELMLIADPAIASKEWDRVEDEIQKTLTRYGATILSLKKWGERKLAYKLKRQQRGTYVLVYFQSPADGISKIVADLELSETILRALVLQLKGEFKEKEMPKDFETDKTQQVAQ